ncbi:LAETG motif-containing sortase-dependent surface protein [Streptomyces paludis]|uniref:LPXTG cell wall anchor domain-containing protein n=1 Tax=Streptomyces paludis TaxID=2282738 RepID=A0A345HWJ9_9ACTN|nr:LAETG motif-containing sortase-dependent surface protein [Streptomyces paludis]AXG81073.1 LPXTG cell wall anchor domain-containing protein [Streptomyces paludis]
MAISRRVTALRLLGIGAAALAFTTAAAGSAWAGDCPGGKGWDKGNHGGYKPGTGAGTPVTPVTTTDKCEFSLDGRDWYSQIKVDDINLKPADDGKVHVKVRTASDSAKCTVSLASYRTHGPTWNTSGEQVFHDFDSVEIKHGGQDTLDVAFPDVGCYAQVDLYRGKIKYDGLKDANDGFEHGDLPIGPSRPVIKDKLIAAWNGGTKNCTTQEIPPAPEPSTETPSEEPPPAAETPSTEEPSEPPTPEESTPESPEPSTSEPTPATSEPTPTASEPTDEASSTPPNTPTEASTGGTGGGGDLAETGGGNVVPIAAGAAVLLAAGGAVVIMTRRRKAVTGA